jgi:hypothetical protein
VAGVGEALLMEMGIDLSPLQAAGEQGKTILQALNSLSDTFISKTKQATTEQKAIGTQAKATADAAIKAVTEALTKEEAKIGLLQKQNAEILKQLEVVVERNKELTRETSTLEKQLVLLKEHTSEIHKQREGGEGGLGKEAISKISGALLGGTAGAVTKGVLTGTGVAVAIGAATEGLAHLIEKLKDVSVEAGKLTLLNDQFQRLAQGAGVDATKMMLHLQEATEGLVGKFALTRLAVAALQSPLKLSSSAIVELTGSLVKIVEYSGGTAQQAIDRLYRALHTGQIRTLATLPGMDRFSLTLQNISSSATTTARRMGDLNNALDVIRKRAEALGATPVTLEQAIERMQTASADLFLSFGQGVNKALSGQFLEALRGDADALRELSDKAEEFGEKVGHAFELIYDQAKLFAKTLFAISPALQLIGGSADDLAPKFSFFAGTAKVLTLVETGLRLIAVVLKDIYQTASDLYVIIGPGLFTEGLDNFIKASNDIVSKWGGIKLSAGALEEIKKIRKDAEDAMEKIELSQIDIVTPTTRSPIERNKAPDVTKTQDLLRAAREKLAEQKLLATLRLDAQESEIQRERQLDDDAYRYGEKTLAAHIAREFQLSDEEFAGKRTRAKLDYVARKSELETEQKDKLAQPLANRKQINEEYDSKIRQAWYTYQAQLEQFTKAQQAKDQEIRKQGQRQQYQIDLVGIQETLHLQEQQIQEEDTLAKTRLSHQQINVEEYLQLRLDNIVKLSVAQEQELQAQRDAAIENGQFTEKVQADIEKKRADYIERLRQQGKVLQESMPELRLQGITGRYQPQTKALESQIGYQQQYGGGVLFPTSNIELTNQLVGVLKSQLEALIAEAKKTDAVTDPKTWFAIYEQILHVTEAQAQWNDKLSEMMALTSRLAPSFEQIGKSIEANFHSKFAQNLGGMVSNAAKSLQDSFKLGAVLSGKGVAIDPRMQELEDTASGLFSKIGDSSTGLVDSFTRLNTAVQSTATSLLEKKSGTVGAGGGSSALPADALISTFTALYSSPAAMEAAQRALGAVGAAVSASPTFTPVSTTPATTTGEVAGIGEYQGPTIGSRRRPASTPSTATDPVKQLTDKFIAAVTAVDSFTNAILGSKNALTGAAAGGIGGAGLGSTIGTAFKDQLGFLGPFAGVIGGVGGAALGAIIGQKNKQVTDNINNLNASFKQISAAFADNANNLNLMITQLQALLDEARQMQASSKKGSAQYQQVIDQYQSQIQQLSTQQDQLLIKLHQQLAILSAPIGAQPFLNDLQAIIQQYQQFEGAAKNAGDLAMANQYLVESLKNYEVNLETQLAQDNQNAINDALQLNDLLYQRMQMMLQYNDQVRSVLTQGVLTRTPTRAQTAGQQIQQITVQYQMQKAQLDEQISATAYRVSAEQQIFNLASDRIGLENQLLALQNQQASIQLNAVQALSGLVTQFQTADLSGPLGLLLMVMQTVTNPAAGVTAGTSAYNVLMQLIGLLNGGSVTPTVGSNLFDTMAASAYQNRAGMGYSTFRGTNL